jgi:hypothetical protein
MWHHTAFVFTVFTSVATNGNNFNCCPSVHVDNHTIITPTKCTLLLLKAPDITICTLSLKHYTTVRPNIEK